MKISSREQWMLALMVPVVAFVGAELAVLRPLRRNVADLNQEMNLRGERSAWQLRLQTAQNEVGSLHSQLEDARADLDKTLPKLDHAAALKEVSRLCSEGGLSLISTAQEAGPALVPALQSVVPLIAAQNGGATPEAWKIDLRGSYGQVRKLVNALATAQAFIVPLQLGMKTDLEAMEPTSWVLTLWL